jgi:hypothetical protein
MYAVLTGQATPSQWQVHVLTQLETLLGENEHPAETAGGQFLPARVARDLAAQGALRRVLVDEDGRLVAVEASTDRPSTDRLTQGAASQARVPAQRAETDVAIDAEAEVEVDLVAVEPDPYAPSADDLAWFETQQWRARVCDPLPVPAVTDVDTEPDEDPREVAVQEPPAATAADAVPEPRASADEESPSEVAAEDVLAVRLQRLLARPFTPADLSSPGYRPNRALRRHLALRDRTCRFPGCPNRICDLDHVTVWPAGPTSAANLARECEHHHQAKHQHFDVRLLPDGTVRWTDRGGRHFDSPVPTVLLSAEFHDHQHGSHQRRDRRQSTDPPADGPEDP